MSDFVEKVRRFCADEELLSFDGVIVGLSGGPDSVALLKVLKAIFTGDIRAVHINHNLRPVDCDKDEAFVRDLCSCMDIPLICRSFDIAQMASELGRTEEEMGRIVRYRVFEEVRSGLAGEYAVATAHHGDDLAETFMMNLFRGSGLEGLRGIKAKSGSIIRPFLCVTKKEILDYLGDTPYCLDQTNSELNTTRNMWRNKILPEIAEVSIKEPEAAIRDTSSLLATDLDYISQEVYRAFDACKEERSGYVFLSVKKIAGLHQAILSRVIRHLYLYTAGSLKDFETVNLNTVLGMLDMGGSAREQMPFGITAFVQSDLLGFAREEDLAEVMDVLAEAAGFVTASGDCRIELTLSQIRDGFTAGLPDSGTQIRTRLIENCEEIEYNTTSWFCPVSLISDGLTVEGQLGGEVFAKAGASGSKQVRRIFTDLKVPKEVRGRIIGIKDGGELCFIPGIGHSKGFVSPESRLKCGGEGEVLEISFVRKDER